MNSLDHRDPFTGSWTFLAERSKLSTPPPRSWIQHIEASLDRLSVREEIVASNGVAITISVRARFDGREYAVSGSPLADKIAYTRVDRNHISGIAQKNGNVSLRETIAVSPDGHTLTLIFSAYSGAREVANGMAMFERADG